MQQKSNKGKERIEVRRILLGSAARFGIVYGIILGIIMPILILIFPSIGVNFPPLDGWFDETDFPGFVIAFYFIVTFLTIFIYAMAYALFYNLASRFGGYLVFERVVMKK